MIDGADYRPVLARLAEKMRAGALGHDLLVRALEISRFARAEYRWAEAQTRLLCEAFVAGACLWGMPIPMLGSRRTWHGR